MDLRDSYKSLREELLDRYSPHTAVLISGFLAGLAIPLSAAAVALAILSIGAIARYVSGSGPSAGFHLTWDVAVGLLVIFGYSGMMGVLGGEAWRLGDRWHQRGTLVRFIAFTILAYPVGLVSWLWLSDGGIGGEDLFLGSICAACLIAMIAHLVWYRHYLDLLDLISPVRWGEAAIRMLREDYYDDWARYNAKLARFKHETQLVRAGKWDEFILVEREERRLLAEEERQREMEILELLRPDLFGHASTSRRKPSQMSYVERQLQRVEKRADKRGSTRPPRL